jgi:hypothetical protein
VPEPHAGRYWQFAQKHIYNGEYNIIYVYDERSRDMMAFRQKYTEKPKIIEHRRGSLSGGYMKNNVDVEQLAVAIQHSVPERAIPDADAKRIAHHILNFFGYGERIIDNVLEPEDRDVFYTLEDVGILTTEREETTLYDGREWRIHYWIFRKERVLELLNTKNEKDEYAEEDPSAIYYQIPDEVWNRVEEEETK